jgi:cyanate permease
MLQSEARGWKEGLGMAALVPALSVALVAHKRRGEQVASAKEAQKKMLKMPKRSH